MTTKHKSDDHKDDDRKPDEHEHKPEPHKPVEYKPEPDHKPEEHKPPDAAAEAEKPSIVARDEAPPPIPGSQSGDRPPNWPYPPPETIVDEQRERSKAIQAAGVEKWKAEHDERPPDAGPKQVPGVGPTQVSEKAGPAPESWQGSTRSTPAAREAQNKAAPS